MEIAKNKEMDVVEVSPNTTPPVCRIMDYGKYIFEQKKKTQGSKKKQKIISYTRVSADIFHYGHLKLFEKARAVSDYHICGLYEDELCIKLNGSLVMKYNEREAVIKKFDFVDEIIKFLLLIACFKALYF